VRRRPARSCAALLAAAIIVLPWSPASAQEDPIGNVDISFDVGEFDNALGDWPIDVVEVSGDLADGEAFTVELRDGDGVVLWSATQPYSDAPTRIAVDRSIAVADVAEAGVSQPLTIVAGVQIERPEVTWSASGGGGGSGQLALSMVLAIIVVAVIFRTPLPSASTQRWTR
jgi:hypothetical protein